MAVCSVFLLYLRKISLNFFEFLCRDVLDTRRLFSLLIPTYVFFPALHPSSPLSVSPPCFRLSMIFPRRVVAVMHFAVALSVQPVCGLCHCMHMQFNYWCSPLTAGSALYGSLPPSNIPGDIVLCGAECLNVHVCLFVCVQQCRLCSQGRLGFAVHISVYVSVQFIVMVVIMAMSKIHTVDCQTHTCHIEHNVCGI